MAADKMAEPQNKMADSADCTDSKATTEAEPDCSERQEDDRKCIASPRVSGSDQVEGGKEVEEKVSTASNTVKSGENYMALFLSLLNLLFYLSK